LPANGRHGSIYYRNFIPKQVYLYMENKGLLFIPDISGFSRFVTETEIGHSRLIIQELLEVLIHANDTGLQVSEIEGDAILFYKFGDPPALETLYKQVEKMFCDFHRNILAYELRRFCQCEACRATINLTLKVISHYGEFTGYTVQHFSKLIGKDVIVAHQLLKNDINQHEYWLVTNSLLTNDSKVELPAWMQWYSSAKQTESGEVPFQYAQLSRLKNEIQPDNLPRLELSNKKKMLSVTREYEAGIILLFHATGDFNYRSRWRTGVKAVEEVAHFLPRIGMQCRCIMENGQVSIYSSSYSFHPDRIEFSETDMKDHSTVNYTLEKTGDNTTRLTIDLYLEKNFISEMMFNLFKKRKAEADLHQSLLNLVQLTKEIKLPD
jgi:hypothetical protein